MNEYQDIYTFIQTQETAYKLPIRLPGDWEWGMQKHIETSYLYNHSQLTTGKDDFKPVKNITRPIINLQRRTEDIEVTDVQLYIDNPDKYHLSFLVKKYHDDVFVRENDMDTYFDECNDSRITYGAGLSKKLYGPRPEVVPLQSIVFCDQTDILSGPIGIKHFYSPDQLMDMASKGWGEEKNGATGSLPDVIRLAREIKQERQNDTDVKTPGKYIEIYEVHGSLPRKFLNKNDTSELFSNQLHIVTFYQKATGEKGNITLYAAEEPESPFKLIKRDPVYGRALGFGGVEELFEAQVWVNYDMIRMKQMLDAAAVTVFAATGMNATDIARRNKLEGLKNMEVLDMADGELKQVDTFPRNLQLFENSVVQWEAHAQQMGAANDAIMGEQPTAGTPFKLQELVTSESHGLHEYRRGQYAKYLEEIYNDWIIPHIQKKICEGATFLSELSLDELQFVTDSVVTNLANQRIKDMILAGEEPTPEMADVFKELLREEFKKKGTKHFVEILKGEFKNTKLGVKVSIAGKSKNLAAMTDKVVNIFRFAFSNPAGFAQVMQIPGMGKAFNEILEFSGLSPVDFSGIDKIAQPQPEPQPQTSPIQPQPLPQPVAA